MLEDSEWVHHFSTPLKAVNSHNGDVGALHDLLSQRHRKTRPNLRQEIESRLAEYDIDEEAKAKVEEALRADEAGLRRRVCNVLIPEIERVARRELHGEVRPFRELTARAGRRRGRARGYGVPARGAPPSISPSIRSAMRCAASRSWSAVQSDA